MMAEVGGMKYETLALWLFEIISETVDIQFRSGLFRIQNSESRTRYAGGRRVYEVLNSTLIVIQLFLTQLMELPTIPHSEF